MVLRHMIDAPECLDSLDIGALLVYPDHRQAYAAMRVAYLRTKGQAWTRFYMEWLAECERRSKGLSGIFEWLDSEWNRWLDERMQDESGDRNALMENASDWRWWLERLRAVHQARQLIEAAQEIASRAWRMPDDPYSVDAAITRLSALRQEVAPVEATEQEESLLELLGLN
jgi:hypothetical protein